MFRKELPKEERRAITEDARTKLVSEMVATEPKAWRPPADLAPTQYAEAWANEILPQAIEAHTRLEFRGVKPKLDDKGTHARGRRCGRQGDGGWCPLSRMGGRRDARQLAQGGLASRRPAREGAQVSPRGPALALIVAAPLLCFPASTAQSCACCSEEGQYSRMEGSPSDYQIAQVSGMQFASTVETYFGAGDQTDVKGVTSVADRYELNSRFEDHQWKLSFRDEKGNTGTLTLPLKGAKVTDYRADIHDGQTSAGGGPLLHKEWVFRGTAQGSGVFKAGFAAPAKFTLIFQGRGNNCDNGDDFTHWRLEISGSKAEYAFVGEMVTAATQESAELPETPAASEAPDKG